MPRPGKGTSTRGPTFAPYGGTVLFRGSKAQPLSGSAHGDRIVVAAFPDMDALRAWHASPAYQALIALRDAGAEVVLTACQS
jgi:uncharacterized protein (DUF1330 family)